MGNAVRITDHAYHRGRKRMGIPRKSLERMADKAIRYGVPCTRAFQCGASNHSAINLLSGNHVFVFELKPDAAVLLTVLPAKIRGSTVRPE